MASAPEARIVVSWWGREVQVWRLPERTSDPVGLDSELEGPRPPKVLKRMLIKGSSDITSASISSNGSLLVVSTTAELKLFQLDLESSISAREELRVTRIVLPENVGNLGASLSRVSPNGKWICLVREGSELMVLKTAFEPSTGHFCVHPGSSRQRLRRLPRVTTQAAPRSWINTYSRRISHIAFAPDSRMLATADLAGYVDTWLVRDGVGGHDVEGGNDALLDSSSSHDSSTDDSSDDGNAARVPGDAWIRNPTASLVPRLPSAVTVLSFSGAAIPEDPAAQGITARAYELLAITSTSRLLLFDAVGGTLAPWSRRNRYIQLPEAFRSSRDLIKGALWQGSRVWLYGLSSLFMIDLSRDLPNENGQGQGPHRPKQGTKRKRDNNSSGAGSRMETGSLDSLKVQRAVPADNGCSEWVDVEMDDADEARQDAQEYDEDDESDGSELQAMRAARVADGDEAKEKTGGAGWWHSFKYRPILGAVPLESSAAASTPGASRQRHLEMALVERPLWDVLPSKYVADDERDDRVPRDYP